MTPSICFDRCATWLMFLFKVCVDMRTLSTVLETSLTATDCCSEADAMFDAREFKNLISSATFLLAFNDAARLSFIISTCCSICVLAVVVCCANRFTSLATTENPFPASPALAASMEVEGWFVRLGFE